VKIDRENIITLAEQEWQEFLALLERPVNKDMPKLARLMQEPSPFDEGE
jgi:uncharacterized protein (DUF1778 family)